MSDNNINLEFVRNKLYCQCCEYKTTKTSDWLKHIQTKKHARNGYPKITICSICNKQFTNTHVLKYHKLMMHAPIEEKLNYKYYCKSCDIIFLSESYYLQHNISKKHANVLKTINSLKLLNIIDF